MGFDRELLQPRWCSWEATAGRPRTQSRCLLSTQSPGLSCQSLRAAQGRPACQGRGGTEQGQTDRRWVLQARAGCPLEREPRGARPRLQLPWTRGKDGIFDDLRGLVSRLQLSGATGCTRRRPTAGRPQGASEPGVSGTAACLFRGSGCGSDPIGATPLDAAAGGQRAFPLQGPSRERDAQGDGVCPELPALDL